MADVFTPELTFGNFQSGIMTPTAPGAPFRTIQNNTFSPASLFAAGAQGFWLDASDLSTMFQSGTRAAPGTPVSSNNDPIGLWLDKSGRQNDFSVAGANRPLWKTSGGLSWAEFDGVDDVMLSATGDLSASPKLAIFAAASSNNAANAGILINQASLAPAAGGFHFIFNIGLGGNAPLNMAIWDGTNNTSYYENAPVAPPKPVSVMTGLYDFSGTLATDELQSRRNGVALAMTAVVPGPCNTVNFANSFFRLGDVGGAGYLSGRIYQLIALGGGATAAQISSTEAFLGTKSGVSF